MISDLALCRACIDTYAPGAVPTWNTEDVHAFLTMQDGYAVIAFQGSASVEDWLRDFDAFVVDAHTLNHRDLGLLHAGFFGDVAEIFGDVLKGLPGDPIAVTGHSKGAAEALIFAAMLTAATDRVIAKVSTFGTPRPGRLNNLLDGIAGADYRNRSDPVCAVPPYLTRPRALVELNAAPLPDDPWGPLADHHAALYAQGVTTLIAERTAPG